MVDGVEEGTESVFGYPGEGCDLPFPHIVCLQFSHVFAYWFGVYELGGGAAVCFLFAVVAGEVGHAATALGAPAFVVAVAGE
jgi:hypothetical protein